MGVNVKFFFFLRRGRMSDAKGVLSQILAWLCFNVATQTLMGVVFMLCGGYQMVLWGVQKHKKLKRTFDGKEGRPSYPSSRWIVLPPFL